MQYLTWIDLYRYEPADIHLEYHDSGGGYSADRATQLIIKL